MHLLAPTCSEKGRVIKTDSQTITPKKTFFLQRNKGATPSFGLSSVPIFCSPARPEAINTPSSSSSSSSAQSPKSPTCSFSQVVHGTKRAKKTHSLLWRVGVSTPNSFFKKNPTDGAHNNTSPAKKMSKKSWAFSERRKLQ